MPNRLGQKRDKATQEANIIVPAKIDKEKIEINAEAVAERIRREAKGQADAIFLKNGSRGKRNVRDLK